jgi:hypothetical protein
VKGEKLCKLLWFVREMRRGLYRVSLGEVMAFWEVAQLGKFYWLVKLLLENLTN